MSDDSKDLIPLETEDLYANAPPLPTHKATDLELNEADAFEVNVVLQYVRASWPNVRSVMGVCALATTTMKLLEARRKLLQRPYGAKADGSAKGLFTPLD